MANETTKAFRRLMLDGRMNELMTEAVIEGIAETERARKTSFVPSGFMTPTHPSQPHMTLEQIDAELEIPAHVLQKIADKKAGPA